MEVVQSDQDPVAEPRADGEPDLADDGSQSAKGKGERTGAGKVLFFFRLSSTIYFFQYVGSSVLTLQTDWNRHKVRRLNDRRTTIPLLRLSP